MITNNITGSHQELIRGLHNIKPCHRGNVLTIGSYDGVHCGHQAILRQVLTKARELNLPASVMIFEPQPHEFFAKEKAPARLMSFKEKVHALFQQGVDRVVCLSFNQRLSRLTAQQFTDSVLVNALDVKYLVLGDDFRFGSGRKGSYTTLKSAAVAKGFTVTNSDSFLLRGQRVSSTKIRECLKRSDFNLASILLGRAYTITGQVVRGRQIGRTLGVPTANIHLHRFRSPLAGVFAVSAVVQGDESHRCDMDKHTRLCGVANVGVRPTLGRGGIRPILEVHLLDYDADLYGKVMAVEFCSKLRDEKRFENLSQLQQQIEQDVVWARKFFAENCQNQATPPI